jgi:hypothetical protein
MEGANLQKQETLGKYSSIGRATIQAQKSKFTSPLTGWNELPVLRLL